jgi:CheY-like chemotaxis protein
MQSFQARSLSSRFRLQNGWPRQRRLSVVVVDDNRGDMELLEAAFEEMGELPSRSWYDSGSAALSSLRAHERRPEALPHAMLIDLNLPGLNGFEVVTALKSLRAFARIPVAMWSSSNSSRDRQLARAVGAAAYFVKPLDLSGYLPVAHWLLKSCRAHATLGAGG